MRKFKDPIVNIWQFENGNQGGCCFIKHRRCPCYRIRRITNGQSCATGPIGLEYVNVAYYRGRFYVIEKYDIGIDDDGQHTIYIGSNKYAFAISLPSHPESIESTLKISDLKRVKAKRIYSLLD